MIVRIFADRQYRIADDLHDPLNVLDDAVVDAVDAKDETAYRERFAELLAYVREKGEELGDDELLGSDVLLPPDDLSFEEACREFTGEGLVPDPTEA